MSKLQRYQLAGFDVARVGISGFTTSAGGSDVVTAEITASLTGLGQDGSTPPLQVSTTTTQGVALYGNNNVVVLFDPLTGRNIEDVGGDTVYAELSEAGGAYTLTYYTGFGVAQAPYSFPIATNIDFAYSYQFADEVRPYDAFNDIPFTLVTGGGAITAPLRTETLTVTALNTFSALSRTPDDNSLVYITVNGVSHKQVTGEIIIAGTTVTPAPLVVGYDIPTGALVTVFYSAN